MPQIKSDNGESERPMFPLSPAAIQRLRAHDQESGREPLDDTPQSGGQKPADSP